MGAKRTPCLTSLLLLVLIIVQIINSVTWSLI